MLHCWGTVRKWNSTVHVTTEKTPLQGMYQTDSLALLSQYCVGEILIFLIGWALQYFLQFIPFEPGHMEDSSCTASVFALNLTFFSWMRYIKSRHVPSSSSLVFKKEGKYKYTSLSLQSIQRNWCCNIKTTEFTVPIRTCSVQLTCHTRVMFTVYFTACLMHKFKYKPKKVIG